MISSKYAFRKKDIVRKVKRKELNEYMGSLGSSFHLIILRAVAAKFHPIFFLAVFLNSFWSGLAMRASAVDE